MSTNESVYLKHCLKAIIDRQKWGDPSTWTGSNFNRLSEELFQVSGISISHRTLRRIFGKDMYRENHNPQIDTKNALSILLGYENWDDFIRNYEINEKDTPLSSYGSASRRSINSKAVLLILLAIAVIGTGIHLFLNRETKVDLDLLNFRVVEKSGYIPFSATFKFDLSHIKSDNIVFKAGGGQDSIRLSKEDTTIIKTLKVPQYRSFSIKVDGKVVSTVKVLAKSNEWETGFIDRSNYYPVKASLNTPGLLSVDQNEFLALKNVMNTKENWLKFQKYEDYNVSTDNLRFEAKIRGDSALTEIKCHNTSITLISKNSRINLNFTQKGCEQYALLHIGDQKMDGVKHNLSGLITDIRNWHIYKIEFKQNKISISIDDGPKTTFTYEGTLGPLYGIWVKNRGLGMMDYIKLYDLGGKEIYVNDFD
jgi:hypothetical protein